MNLNSICRIFFINFLLHVTATVAKESLENIAQALKNETNLTSIQKDALAFRYVELNPKSRIFCIYPYVVGTDYTIVRKNLKSSGDIIYEKDIYLEGFGPFWYLQHVYYDNQFFGRNGDNLVEIEKKMYGAFGNECKSGCYVRAFLVDLYDAGYSKTHQSKKRIREIYGSLHAAHSNHARGTNKRFAQAIYLQNTLDFFNARIAYFPSLERLLDAFEKELKTLKIKQKNCCIVGDAVQAAYGKRECQMIQYVSTGSKEIQSGDQRFISVNRDYSDQQIEEQIHNPANYFYYRGFKFSLNH